METGNKAVLVTSEECQSCGKCCQEFVCGGFDLDCAVRFMWINDRKIKARDSEFRDDFGAIKREVVFKHPCSKLVFEKGKYSCSAWNETRPNFCNTYPDHIFYHVDIWDTIRIKKLIEEGSKDCPALKNVTVEQVQAMLKERRKTEDD